MVASRLKSLFGLGADEDEALPSERRVDPRRKVLLGAEVYPIEGYAEMTVQNASRTGLAGETPARLTAGHPLLFSVEANHFHIGTIKWVRGARFGLDLDDALGILGHEEDFDPGHATSHQVRARRYDVNVKGRVVIAPNPFRATVRDVSQSGLCLDTALTLPDRQQVLVRIRDRPLILGSVQWGANGRLGVKTSERIATLRLVYDYE
jgi:hypothetical protein